jgi:SM-20-related protein
MAKQSATHSKPLEFGIGPQGRRVFILDDLIEPDKVGELYKFFRKLPYSFSNSDRFDTTDYRHFGYRFEEEPPTEHPVVAFFASAAISHLRSRRINVGQVKRAYVNLSLYGDIQFAHEDGDEWTAVAFVNETWNADWGGELLIYDESAAGVAYAIRPVPARMVVFDGLLTHRGGVPSKLTAEPRITLAIKMSR